MTFKSGTEIEGDAEAIADEVASRKSGAAIRVACEANGRFIVVDFAGRRFYSSLIRRALSEVLVRLAECVHNVTE